MGCYFGAGDGVPVARRIGIVRPPAVGGVEDGGEGGG